MLLYRLVKKQHAQSLSGVGASIVGGRWNSIGIEVIYTAANRALAMAEVAVHFSYGDIPTGYKMISIETPEKMAIFNITNKDLPANWNKFPYLTETQLLGDKFLQENKYCLLRFPSAVVKGDYNILIDPNHSQFKYIKIIDVTDFPFDKRLFWD